MGGLWKEPNFLDQIKSRWTFLEYFHTRKCQDPNQRSGFKLDSSNILGRHSFICLHIHLHGFKVLILYPRNVDVKFHFISSRIGEWGGLGISVPKLGIVAFLIGKKKKKEKSETALSCNTFSFFFFKTVKTPRETEQLVSLITNHQQKQEDCRKFLCHSPLATPPSLFLPLHSQVRGS